MAIRIYKPTSPGRRKASVSTFEELSGARPHKSLLRPHPSQAGRNSQGKITVRHRGGGVKRYYRVVDFLRDKFDVPAKVKTIEYDPNRNARIARVSYADGVPSYIIAPIGLAVGDTVMTSRTRIDIRPGNRMPLSAMPLGTLVYDVELTPLGGSRVARSAGTLVKLLAVDGPYAHLKLPSTEVRMVPKGCLATVGQVSNPDAMHVRLGKAGRNRRLGVRPRVRGKAMNPVDHPHGGGEGNQPIGLKYPKTPWGKHALGVKTRRKHRWSNQLILSRRRKD